MLKSKLLHVIPYNNSFINNDEEILRHSFIVKTLIFGNKNNLLIPFYLIKQFLLLLFYIPFNKTILIQFGGYHSVLPTILGAICGKKVFVIVHGTDACSFKEINYGILRKKILRKICYLTYRYCYKILPVSNSLIFTENNYFSPSKTYLFGLRHEFPNLPENKFEVIANGLDLDLWQINKSRENNNTFITVAGGQSIIEIRKGIDMIINHAHLLKNCTFIIVGLKETDIESQEGNILFLPKVSQKELKTLFLKSTYYIQLSVFEGFGLALCEAMLCGCIPIVSNVNVLPEIIGNSGFILYKKDKNDFVELINHIIGLDSLFLKQLQENAEKQIRENYSLQIREEKLTKILKVDFNLQ